MSTPGREDAALSAKFAKDQADEDLLRTLNAALAPHEEASYRDLEERWPTLHVVGLPRSGTTLVNQLVASHLSVRCIDNLAAAFWAAPCMGIRLSKKLLPEPPPSSYRSTYGRTHGISEPHEFGYFWASHLGYREMREPDDPGASPIDWARLGRVLTNMTDAAGGPLVFKSFVLAFYAAEIQRVLPRTCFVWVRRRPLDNAASIATMRRTYSGDETHWTSLKPREYAWLRNQPVPSQIAGQVVYGEAALRRAVERNGGRNVLEVAYEDVCADPGAALERIRVLLNANRGEVTWVRDPPPALAVPPPPEGDEAEVLRRELEGFAGVRDRG